MSDECRCEDLRAILALQAQFCQLCDLAKWAEMRELFTDDAVLHVFGKDYTGKDAIMRFIERRHLGKHMLSAPDIEFDGDEARVVVDHTFYRYPDLALFGAGVYKDVLRRTPAGWKFARREIEVHGHHVDMTAAAKQNVKPIADTLEEVPS
jgi:SnoaL-like domain